MLRKENTKSEIKLLQDELKDVINTTNKKIEELGDKTARLYDALTDIQSIFDLIRNIPTDEKLKYEEIKKNRINWKQHVDKIDKDYHRATIKNTGIGVAGAGAGTAVAVMGPTAAMSIATAFGVASTGTPICMLSGAAATNAALAWLGGGAVVAGGGGMAAGNFLLILAGPIGWGIAGMAASVSAIAFLRSKKKKNQLEYIFILISKRDIKRYNLATVELSERIKRIVNESRILENAIDDIKSFGRDYSAMNEEQQYKLGSYVNLMNSSTQLLVNPIQGLQPKYTEDDLKRFLSLHQEQFQERDYIEYIDLLTYLSNLLYKIELSESDRNTLFKFFRKNKELLDSMNISKKEFSVKLFDIVFDIIHYKELTP